MRFFLCVEIYWFRNGIKEGFTLVAEEFTSGVAARVWLASLSQQMQQLNNRLQLTEECDQIRFEHRAVDTPSISKLYPYVAHKMGTVQLAKEAERRFAVTAGVIA